MKKPNFLIVGAAKSGTTSLFHYLRQHPAVFMPDFKEPQYLVHSKIQGRLHKYITNREDYLNLFSAADQQCIGEASVFYLYFYEEAIANIKKELGENVKIIIMLREPVSRTVSAYEHVFRNNIKEQLSFTDALAVEEGRLEREQDLTPMAMYKSMSMYADAVKAYQEAFQDVHIALYDDFQSSPKQCIDQIFEFLGLESCEEIDYLSRHNIGGWQWENEKVKQLALSDGFFKKIARVTVPKFLRKYMFKKLKSKATDVQKIAISQETKKELSQFFQEDVHALEDLINRKLTAWYDVA